MEYKNIVTDLVESRIRKDNEELCKMNRELMTRLDEATNSLRRTRSINRLQAMNAANLQNEIRAQQLRIDDLERYQGVQYAAIREYFVNNEEARIKWQDQFSFHDEIFESAVRNNIAFGIQYNGLEELVDTETDEEMLNLLAEDEEIQDITDNWL